MKYLANHTQHRWRAVGGGISVEPDALYFTPHKFDLMLGGKAVAIRKDAIQDITVEPGRISLRELASGGLRDRMKIVSKDGSVNLFVVSCLKNVITDLKQWQREQSQEEAEQPADGKTPETSQAPN